MNPVEDLRISQSRNEPPMQASKWLQVQALIDEREMAALFQALGHFEIFLSGSLCPAGKGYLSQKHFLELYAKYVEALRSGALPADPDYRSSFSSVFTAARDLLFRVKMDDGRHIIRTSKPVVQLQMHKMDYSTADEKFRPMVFGAGSIYWGLQFSYPQLYQEPVTKEILHVADTAEFPNTRLFHLLRRWMRSETIPTPFLVGTRKMNVPMRLGKNCLDWINRHPQLVERGLKVHQGINEANVG